MNTVQNQGQYLVEFNGSDYVVLMGIQVVAAFATIDEAFAAKRRFQERPHVSDVDKTPPAMRMAKAQYYSNY